MPALINFKICDNSPDCGGIEACPNKVFSWDENSKKIVIDNSKCNSCGLCEQACPIGAIKVAKNKKEYDKIKGEIDKDKRKISDLFVDRYGSQPIEPAFLVSPEKFDIQILKSSKLAVVEFFNKSSINCLLCSIPIGELFKNLDLKYAKVEANEELIKRYNIKNFPALLFFKEGRLIGRIEGYYSEENQQELFKKVKEII